MMKGLVMRSTGSFYDVLLDDGRKMNCRVRGKIRLEGIKETNPVAVGDHVLVDLDDAIGSITEILPRANHMLRQSVKKTGHAQVLAANVDQVMLIATLKLPRTSLGFIDRFFVAAEAFRIPQILVFNKHDLLGADEQEEVEALKMIYSAIGIRVFVISAMHDTSFDALVAALSGKVTLVAGHSGVGKSTLLNRLLPGVRQAVGEISNYSDKGTHTTTFAEMFPLNSDSFLIDTPGVKEWGLVEMEPQEISDYFPEMRDLRLNCKFGARCIHLSEPGCAIKAAVENGQISFTRYDSYLSMVAGDDNRK